MTDREQQMSKLTGQAAIVTGAGSGIGEATAIRFVREGASVVLVGRTRSKLENVANQINQPDRVAIVAGDVAQLQTAESAIKIAQDRFKRLDIVVNNAAMFEPTPFPQTDLTKWRTVFDIILQGAFHFTREASRV